MSKFFIRILAAVLLVDGLLTATLGRKYLCRLRLGPPGNPFRRVVEWFIGWPAWLLRSSAAFQAAAGASMFVHRAPAQRVVLED